MTIEMKTNCAVLRVKTGQYVNLDLLELLLLTNAPALNHDETIEGGQSSAMKRNRNNPTPPQSCVKGII